MELVLDHGQAVGHRRAAHCRPRHPDRLPADPPEIHRPERVRVRHDDVVRDSRHRDRRRLHPRLQRPADRDHRHRADPHRLQRLSQHAGRRARRDGGDEPDRPQPRRSVDDAGRARLHHVAHDPAAAAEARARRGARLQLRAGDDDGVGRHLPCLRGVRVGDDVHHQPRGQRRLRRGDRVQFGADRADARRDRRHSMACRRTPARPPRSRDSDGGRRRHSAAAPPDSGIGACKLHRSNSGT